MDRWCGLSLGEEGLSNVPRASVRETLGRRLRDHLAIAREHDPERYPLDVRSVSAALGVSPTTLYKYGFNTEINAAAQHQQERRPASTSAIEYQGLKNQLRALTAELEKERERNKQLVGLVAIMEANAGRLGFDPEAMYKSILKPVRTLSRAGQGGVKPFPRGSRTTGSR